MRLLTGITQAVASVFAVVQMSSAGSTAAHAQPPVWSLGPIISYGAAMSAPEGSAVSGTPVRVNLGVDLLRTLNSNAALRMTATYRIEQAEYQTTVSEFDRPMVTTSKLNVGDQPGTTDPVVVTRHSLGSFDLAVGAQFTLMPIGTGGSHLFAGIGGMVDRVVTATQTDNWSAVSTLPVGYPDIYDYDLETQTGIGGVAYIGAALSLGSTSIIADLRYVSRTALGDAQPYSWLAGRGIRVGVGMWFPL
jgi:hypothetical protein